MVSNICITDSKEQKRNLTSKHTTPLDVHVLLTQDDGDPKSPSKERYFKLPFKIYQRGNIFLTANKQSP